MFSNLVSTAAAKSNYFLTPDDLRPLKVRLFGGGLGCGAPRKLYEPAELRAAAIRKHGEAGFKKKQEAQQKRESKKRQREEDADRALAALHRVAPPPARSGGGDNPINLDSDEEAAPAPPAAPVPVPAPAVMPPEVAALRKSMLKLAKKALGFTESGGPKSWRVEVPGVQPATFAALAGRPADRTLATFVKSGAYHSHDVDAQVLFGCKESELLRIFKREGVGIQIEEEVTLKYKPSDRSLAMLGGGDIVCDERTMPW